jgi:hypothetical protein
VTSPASSQSCRCISSNDHLRVTRHNISDQHGASLSLIGQTGQPMRDITTGIRGSPSLIRFFSFLPILENPLRETPGKFHEAGMKGSLHEWPTLVFAHRIWAKLDRCPCPIMSPRERLLSYPCSLDVEGFGPMLAMASFWLSCRECLRERPNTTATHESGCSGGLSEECP